MGGKWDFVLTDAAGNALAELSTANSRAITFKRNTYLEFVCTLSHDDDAAALLLTALANTGVPKARGYRRGPNDSLDQPAPLKFRGYLAGLQEQADDAAWITATFRSPFGVILGDGDKLGRQVQSTLTYAATDAGTIAKALIDAANSDSFTGLATDPTLIVATVPRDRSYTVGQNIGTAVSDLTAVLDGFDFYETFVDGAGATDAMFNVVASQGVVNANAVFEYGQTTLSNVQSVTRTTQPPKNCVMVTGGNGLVSIYSDATSVATYGKWWGREDFSTLTEQSTLDAKARALCRPNPVKTVTFVPELGLDSCPKPFDDWNLGDTVTLRAVRNALSINTQLRINGFTLPIDENGLEATTVNDVTSPEDDAVIRAGLIAEVLVG